jgi:hypothetical protein
MSFEDINREIASGGGTYVKLTKKSHGILEGRVINVTIRDKQFNGKVIPNKNGEPRKEWVFTLDVDGEVKKWAAVESAQFAIRGALQALGKDVKLEPNGILKVAVMEDSIQGEKSAEYKVKYTPPTPADTDDPFAGADNEPPF